MTFPERLAPQLNTLKCFITSFVLIRVDSFSFKETVASWRDPATALDYTQEEVLSK